MAFEGHQRRHRLADGAELVGAAQLGRSMTKEQAITLAPARSNSLIPA